MRWQSVSWFSGGGPRVWDPVRRTRETSGHLLSPPSLQRRLWSRLRPEEGCVSRCLRDAGSGVSVVRPLCTPALVDIVPLITKADTISKNDLRMFKSKIMSELISSGIQIYQLPTDEETAAQANSSINISFSNNI
ncbi:septin-2-like [Piliocolobus tephrosceles]|uniref:septin-2-like n=1 Tax=Piliocolobus tephrosceles TaxID=591936 RepID=UPI000E6B448A|nr:septin-2-like [Piliocolobus tephrosceles]